MNVTQQQKIALAAAAMMISIPSMASELAVPNTFTGGSKAVAADVNANFSAVEDAVNDNDARITANETAVSDSDARITANETAIGDNEARVTTNESVISANSDAIAQLSLADGVAYQPSINNTAFIDRAGRVVKSMALDAPLDGHAIVMWNAWYICTSGTCVVRCSIDVDATSLNTRNFTLQQVPNNGYGSLSLTHALPVQAGQTNLVVYCDSFEGQGTLGDMSMVGVFSASDVTAR